MIDNASLLDETNRSGLNLILDVWEDEPFINLDLLAKTKVATPHIAGYSFEGKVNGTKMISDSLCKFLKITSSWQPELPPFTRKNFQLSDGKSDAEKVYKLFSIINDIVKDDMRSVREISNYKLNEQAGYFDLLRKTYPVRREFSNFTVQLSAKEKHLKAFLETFRFKVRVI